MILKYFLRYLFRYLRKRFRKPITLEQVDAMLREHYITHVNALLNQPNPLFDNHDEHIRVHQEFEASLLSYSPIGEPRRREAVLKEIKYEL